MRVFAALAGMTGWVALALQFYLSVVNGSARGLPAGEMVLRYFSFFTILTNMLVALVLTRAVLAPGRGILGRPAVQAATAGYIAVVGLIYVVILRHTWAPTGLQWWVDVALHYAMPLLYLAFWLAFAAKGRLRWAMPLGWLAYPGLYLAWVLARGAASGFYPYPFIDVARLGYGRMAANALGMMLLFLLVGFAFVALDRLLARGRVLTPTSADPGRRAHRRRA